MNRDTCKGIETHPSAIFAVSNFETFRANLVLKYKSFFLRRWRWTSHLSCAKWSIRSSWNCILGNRMLHGYAGCVHECGSLPVLD